MKFLNVFFGASFILSLCFIVNLTASTEKNILSEQQARKYIGHLVDTLFLPTNHSGSYSRELGRFTEDVSNILIRRLGNYPSVFTFSKVYLPREIEKDLIDEAIIFIEQKSISYAKEVLKKLHPRAEINQKAIIDSAVDNIKVDILKIVGKSAILEPGVLTNFFGVPLYNKIHDFIKKSISQLVQMPKYYPTAECPVCFDNFSGITKRIFLACGHNICVECLRRWYQTNGSRVSCPLCRAPIVINNYANELWPPSAPGL